MSTIWYTATIVRKTLITARVCSIRVESEIPRWLPGQHVDIRLTAPDGYQAQRSYSIGSPPDDDALELVIEALDDGEVSPFFFEVADIGDQFEIRGPLGGHFIFDSSVTGPVLMLAGGSGIVPFLSMTRARTSTQPIMLLYSTRTLADRIFGEELLSLEGDTTQIRFAITRESPERPVDFNRRVDAAMITTLLADWGHTPEHVFVCGSNAFVEQATQAVLDNGLPFDSIRTERYG